MFEAERRRSSDICAERRSKRALWRGGCRLTFSTVSFVSRAQAGSSSCLHAGEANGLRSRRPSLIRTRTVRRGRLVLQSGSSHSPRNFESHQPSSVSPVLQTRSSRKTNLELDAGKTSAIQPESMHFDSDDERSSNPWDSRLGAVGARG